MQKDISIEQKNETIERSSLGRVLRLGDLYDARKDAAAGVNIFNGTLPETSIESTDYPNSRVDYEITDRISEKFHKLSVNAELQLSVLAGMVNLQGSGKYLKEDKQSAKAGRMTLLYSITTKLETISISNLELKEIIDLNVIDSFEATHIVVGIYWGANCTITSEYANQENAEQTEVEGLLKAAADKISYAIKGEGQGNYDDKDNEYTKKFSLHSNCDVVTDEEFPSTLSQTIEFVKKLPKLVGQSNNGKGKPLSYILLPISSVIKYFNYEKQIDLVLKQLKEASILRFVHLFEEISLVRQELYDFYQYVQLNSSYLSDQEFQAVTKLQNNFAITEKNLQSKLAETLVDVRSGKSEASKLDDLIKEFEEDEFSPVKVQGYLHSLRDLSKKIKFIDNLLKTGIDYIGKSESLENLIWSNENPEIYVLFFAWSQKEEKSYWKNIKHFFSLIKDDGKENSNHKFIVVDSDLQQEYTSNGTVIHHYIDGELDCEDALAQKIADEQLRKEKELEAQQKLTEEKSKRESYFQAFSDGGNYPKKEINILILGETYQDQLAFINTVTNYMMYDNLTVAKCNPIINIIPSFLFDCDEKITQEIKRRRFECRSKELKLGVFERTLWDVLIKQEECVFSKTGVYSFSCQGAIINLISVDIHGIIGLLDLGKTPFLSSLSTFVAPVDRDKKFHGICSSVQSNCKIQFSQISQASTLQSFFRLEKGRVLMPVNICTPDDSIYCINDQPFDWLATMRQGRELSTPDDWSIQWELAVKETKRLFNQIQALEGNKKVAREVKVLKCD